MASDTERPPAPGAEWPVTDHYISGGVEAIDVIEAFGLGYRLGNVVKYVLRADRKGKALSDLRKARDYLSREIEKREELADASPKSQDIKAPLRHCSTVWCGRRPGHLGPCRAGQPAHLDGCVLDTDHAGACVRLT